MLPRGGTFMNPSQENKFVDLLKKQEHYWIDGCRLDWSYEIWTVVFVFQICTQKKTILSVEDILALVGDKCDGVIGQVCEPCWHPTNLEWKFCCKNYLRKFSCRTISFIQTMNWGFHFWIEFCSWQKTGGRLCSRHWAGQAGKLSVTWLLGTTMWMSMQPTSTVLLLEILL